MRVLLYAGKIEVYVLHNVHTPWAWRCEARHIAGIKHVDSQLFHDVARSVPALCINADYDCRCGETRCVRVTVSVEVETVSERVGVVQSLEETADICHLFEVGPLRLASHLGWVRSQFGCIEMCNLRRTPKQEVWIRACEESVEYRKVWSGTGDSGQGRKECTGVLQGRQG